MTGSTVIHLGEVNAGETPVNISDFIPIYIVPERKRTHLICKRINKNLFYFASKTFIVITYDIQSELYSKSWIDNFGNIDFRLYNIEWSYWNKLPIPTWRRKPDDNHSVPNIPDVSDSPEPTDDGHLSHHWISFWFVSWYKSSGMQFLSVHEHSNRPILRYTNHHLWCRSHCRYTPWLLPSSTKVSLVRKVGNPGNKADTFCFLYGIIGWKIHKTLWQGIRIRHILQADDNGAWALMDLLLAWILSGKIRLWHLLHQLLHYKSIMGWPPIRMYGNKTS